MGLTSSVGSWSDIRISCPTRTCCTSCWGSSSTKNMNAPGRFFFRELDYVQVGGSFTSTVVAVCKKMWIAASCCLMLHRWRCMKWFAPWRKFCLTESNNGQSRSQAEKRMMKTSTPTPEFRDPMCHLWTQTTLELGSQKDHSETTPKQPNSCCFLFLSLSCLEVEDVDSTRDAGSRDSSMRQTIGV